MKRFGISLAILLAGVCASAAEMSLSVTARQRYPWNGFVDVDCTVQGFGVTPLAFLAKDNATGRSLDVKTLTLNGNVWTNGVSAVVDGTYRFVWNAAADVAADYVANDISFTVMNGYPRYVAIDLSEGANATSYPVEYFDDIPGGAWSDEYKTTKLVMRLIPAGTFAMGSPSDELGRSTDEPQREVTLTKPFYMGVFEVTQAQYELVMGSNPSLYTGDARPVESVSWNKLMDSDGFIARVRAKAGLSSCSLPTEAQWEYACRAGTTTALNSGKNLTDRFECANMSEVGRYQYNKTDGKGDATEHAVVGSYVPNAWGLYDMHGNVFEWCSDWYGAPDETSVVDPVGAATGEYRVFRGGCWSYGALYSRSAYRYADYPSYGCHNNGFRLACLLGETDQGYANVPLTLDLRSGTRISNGAEEFVVYDPHWNGDENSTVKVTVRGTSDVNANVLVNDLSSGGVVRWKPSKGGLYELTHTTYQDGLVLETLYAKFEVVKNPDEKYLVIDLSEGTAATSYPTSFLIKPPAEGWTEEYKTTKLVMRYIPAGSFMMQGTRPVTLTEPFYMGVFEVTQRQYELVMGNNSSLYIGDLRPVERLPWDTIMSADGFVSTLREKLGVASISLPTEAQWEYASRAGTTNSFNNGTESMEGLGRYDGNKDDGIGGYSEHTVVGSYCPNAWGLYDMHGNVWEWCLDWHESSLGTESVVDPTGPNSGTTRMARGGAWNNVHNRVALSFRGQTDPAKGFSAGGFRLMSKCRFVSDVSSTGVDVVYNGKPHSIVVSAPDGATVSYATSEGGPYSSTNPQFTDVGTATVWYKVEKVGYNAVVGSATVTITARDIENVTIATIPNQVWTGSEIKPTLTVTDGTPSIVKESDYTVSYENNVNVGTATVTLTGTGNYTGTKTVTFTITKKKIEGEDGGEPGDDDLTVPTGGKSKFDVTVMYDGEGHTINTNALEAVTLTGAEATFEYALTADGAWSKVAPVWTNVVATSVWYRISADNYEPYVHEALVTITNRPVTLTSASKSWTYDGTAHSATTVTVSGNEFVGDDVPTYSNFETITTVGSKKNTFTYTFKDEVVAKNYLVTKTEGTLTVTTGNIVNPFGDNPFDAGDDALTEALEKGAYNAVYDGKEHTISIDVSQLNENLVNKKITYSATKDGDYADVAPMYKDVVSTSVWFKVTADNCNAFVTNATVVITPKALTLTSKDKSKVYDGTALTFGADDITADGYVDGEKLDYSNFASQTTVGSCEAAFVVADSETAKQSNYTITIAKGTLTVTAASVMPDGGEEPGEGEVPTGGKSKFDVTVMYDGEGHTINTNALEAVTLTGADATFEYALAKDGVWSKISPVWTNVVATSVWYRISADNYEPYVHEALVTITNRPVTLTSADGNWAYDGMAHSAETVTVSGNEFVAGDAPSYSNFATITDVGSLKNTFDYTFGNEVVAKNYLVTVVEGILKVTTGTLRPESVSVTGYTGVYDGAGHSISVSAPVGATVTYSLSEGGTYGSTNPTFKDVCDATVWYCVEKTGYVPVGGSATVKITNRSIANVTIAEIAEQVYSGSEIKPSVTVTDIVNGSDIVKVSDYEVTYSDNINAGTATVKLTGKGNYKGTATTTFTIKKKTFVNPFAPDGGGSGDDQPTEEQLAAVGYEGVYDGVAHGINVEAVLNDTVKELMPTITYADKVDGTYRAENYLYTDVVTTSVWYRIAIDNYEPFVTNATVKIIPKEVTIDWIADNFVYNGTDQKASVTASYKDVNGVVIPLTVTTSGEFKDYNESGYVFSVSFANGETNYKLPSEVTKIYHIKKAGVVTVETPIVSDAVVYGTKLSEISIGSWKWVDETIVPTVVNSGYKATLIVDDKSTDYSGVEGYDATTHTITRTVAVVVTAKQVVMPTEDTTTFVYTGSEQTYTIPVSEYYTVAGNKRTNAGSQEVTVALKDKSNYAWTNGTSDDLTFTFTIKTKEIVSGGEEPGGDDLTVPTGGKSKFDVTVMYDGEGHTINTNALEAVTLTGADATFEYALAKDGAWSKIAPVWTNVVATSVWYRISADNYEPYVHEALVTITNRPVTLTSTSDSWAYDGSAYAAPSVVVTGAGFVAGDEPVYSEFASITDVGSKKNTFTCTFKNEIVAKNYLVTKVEGTLKVTTGTLAPESVSATGYTGVYDGAVHSISVSAPDGATITYSLEKDGIYGSTNPTFKDVCDATVWYRVEKTGYSPVSGSASVKITPKALTLTSKTSTKVYDGTDLTFTAEDIATDGYVTGEQLDYSNFASQTVVGSCEATFTVADSATAKQSNYAITITKGLLTVTAASVVLGGGEEPGGDDLTVPTGGKSKFDVTVMYDGDGHTINTNALEAVTLTGAVPTFEYALAKNGAWSKVAPIWTNVVATSVWYKISAPNYEDYVHEALVTITNRPVTLTSASGNWAYDGTAHSAETVTVSGAGFIVGDEPTYSGFASITDVGSKPNTFTYAFKDEVVAKNYLVTKVEGTLKVTTGTLTPESVSATGYTGVYDGAEHSLSVSAPEGATITYSLEKDGTYEATNPTFKDVCDATVWYRVEKTGYVTVSGSATVKITQRALTLTSPIKTKVYDGTALTFGAGDITDEGYVDGEALAYSGFASQTVVGSCEAAFTVVDSTTTKQSNYTITITKGSLTVTAASVVPDGGEEPGAGDVPTGGKSKYDVTGMYDGEGHTINTNALEAVTLTGAVPTFEYALTADGEWSSVAPVWTNVVATSVWYKISAPNYEPYVHEALVTITNRPVTLTSASGSWAYDGTAHSAETVTVSGNDFIAGDAPTYSNFASIKDVGSIENSFTYAFENETVAKNYLVTKVEGTLKVMTGTLAPESVTVTGYTGVYDGAEHSISVSAPVGATITYSLSEGGTYEATNPAFKDVCDATVWYRVEKTGYATVSGSATVKITARNLSNVKIAAIPDQVYNGSEIKPTVTVSDVVDGNNIVKANDYEIVYTDNTNVGTATVTLTGKGNYKGTTTATFTIKKKTLVNPFAPDGGGSGDDQPTEKQLATVGYEGVYDGVAHGINVEAALSDTVKELTPTIMYADKSDGAYRAENYLYTDVVTTSVWYKISINNFEPFVTNATVKITPREVTIDWVADSFVYNGTDQKENVTASYKDVNGAAIPLTVTTSGEFKDYNESGYVFSVSFANGETNYKLPSEVTKVYNIKKAGAPTVETPVVSDAVVYGTKLSEISIGSWKWVDETIVPTVVNSGYQATLIVDDKSTDYSGVEGYDATTHTITRTVAVVVTAKQIAIPAEDTTTFVYTGSEQTYTIPGSEHYTVTGNKRTDAGSQDVTVSLKDKSNYAWTNGTSDDLKFVFTIKSKQIGGGGEEPGGDDLTVPTGGKSKFDVIVMYDGEGHTINTNALESVTLTSATPTFEYSLTADGAWSKVAPVWTNVVATSVWYRISAANYEPYIHEALVTITNRPVTLTSASKSWTYDGMAHSAETVTVSGAGFVAGDEPTYLGFATITDVGNTQNTFTYSFTDEVVAKNYDITIVMGVIAVVAPPVTEVEVVFDALGGTIGSQAVVTQKVTDVYGSLPTAVRENYIFNGWTLGVTNGAPVATVGGKVLVEGAHTLFANWTFDTTSAADPETIFTWEAIDAHAARITGLKNPTAALSKMVIPDRIKGLLVTEIAELAFANLKCGVTEVVLPQFCVLIGNKAFLNLPQLAKVGFAETRRVDDPSQKGGLKIGRYAFSGAVSLTTVYLPVTVAEIGDYAFLNTRKLQNVTILGQPTVGKQVFRSSGLNSAIGGVTVHLDPALATNTVYMDELKANMFNVTVKTDAVIKGLKMASLKMSGARVSLTVSVEKAANWGEVNMNAVRVKYRPTLTEPAQILEPVSAVRNPDGSVVVEVIPPEGESGFFQSVIEQ